MFVADLDVCVSVLALVATPRFVTYEHSELTSVLVLYFENPGIYNVPTSVPTGSKNCCSTGTDLGYMGSSQHSNGTTKPTSEKWLVPGGLKFKVPGPPRQSRFLGPPGALWGYLGGTWGHL